MNTARGLSFCLCFFALLTCLFLYGQVTEHFNSSGELRVILAAVSGCFSIGTFLLWPQTRTRVAPIFIVAILARITLIPCAPSDDVHRYLWEGKLVNQGISPYQTPADDPSLSPHRDQHWQQMNHRDRPTAYPPLAQWSFAAITSAAYHPLAFRITFLIFDLATLAALLALLHHRGLSLAYALFYAINPIILLSFAAEAHFDSAMVAFITFALLAADKKLATLSAIFAALAVGFKITTLVAVPFLAVYATRHQWRSLAPYLITFSLVLAVPLLGHLFDLSSWLSALRQFAATSSFNGPIYDLINRGFALPRQQTSALLLTALAAILAWRFFFHHRAAIDTQLRWAIGSLLLLSPINHFWYLSWIIPFLALRPCLAWSGLCISFAAYFWVWINAELGAWRLLPWQEALFWSPVFLGLAYELLIRKSAIWKPAQSSHDPIDFSIVIPCHQTNSKLFDCLQSIRQQTTPAKEIILVHSSKNRLADDKFIQLQAERGRGNQIHAGIRQASGSWVVVLHADCHLSEQALTNLKRTIKANPDLVSGSLGQRFQPSSARTLLIEILNEIRAIFSHTSFGDQVQFVRRDLALEHDLLPAQPLMEDVELSWRTRELGPTCHLRQPATSCPEKWQRAKFSTRFNLIIQLIIKYRLTRARSRTAASALSRQLYEQYYPTQPSKRNQQQPQASSDESASPQSNKP